MAMFQVIAGESVLFTFRANFTQIESRIRMCDHAGEQVKDTPFRVSDSRSRPVRAAKLINGWCRANGRPCWEKGTRGLILRRVR